MMLHHHRAGEGSPLLLIHGIGSRWQMWTPVLDRLTAHREVIAIDLPGFGGSEMPPDGTVAGPGSLATLVAEFLAQIGVERPHVCGNSLGGLVALELARRGVVRSGHAISPAGFASVRESLVSRSLLWTGVRLARQVGPRADRLMRSPAARAVAVAPFVAHPTGMTAVDAAESLRALADAPWFDATLSTVGTGHFGDGGAIAVPVTISWGEHDRVLPPRQLWHAARAIPQARIVPLPGCGHLATYDDPELVARVMLKASAG